MARILGVGVATVDTIVVVEGYPREDTKVRALERRVRRGGNAATALTVLSDLGHECRFAGVLGEDREAELILADLKASRVDASACRVVPGAPTLTSEVILNRATGSRTIIHHRELPELSFADFERLELESLDWIHFDGRNAAEARRMLELVRARRPRLPRSVEIERNRPGIEDLFAHAEVLIFSRSFAEEWSFSSPRPFLEHVRRISAESHLVCAWGKEGAFALGADGRFHFAPALRLERVVDTLGAGDTFNAGLIDALLRTADLRTALEFANRVAGLAAKARQAAA
ncbi:MAG: PfkB family carbohydrate kinase [Myxococcales bacterium]|jgi:ketohexokinase